MYGATERAWNMRCVDCVRQNTNFNYCLLYRPCTISTALAALVPTAAFLSN
jgi:hypothetical protein